VGQDFFQGSHYDEYNYQWTSYKPGPVDPSVFDLPQICKDLPDDTQQQQDISGRHHHTMQAIALLPGNHHQHAGEAQSVFNSVSCMAQKPAQKHLYGWRPLEISKTISFAFALPFTPCTYLHHFDTTIHIIVSTCAGLARGVLWAASAV
jgi:hypothetical protein